MGLRLLGGERIAAGATLLEQKQRRIQGRWRPDYGIRSEYDDTCEELTVTFKHERTNTTFAIVLRAYDRGVALRYVLQRASVEPRFVAEETGFCFPAGVHVYSSRDEGEYAVSSPRELAPIPHPDLTSSSDAGPLADLPATVLLSKELSVLIAESDRLNYPRAMLTPDPDRPSGLKIHLMRFPGRATGYSGPGDTPPTESFVIGAGQATPWRVVVIAKSHAALIDSEELIATLATPNMLTDTSWVRPGRAVRITKPYTTERALSVLEFARRRKLEFIEFDAHWYGDGTDASDATQPIDGLDLQRVIDRARAVGIGVILYVDRVPAMTQLTAILRAYREWGVAGIKFGFVWEGRQSDNNYIFELVRACGEHRLLVNLHDNLRPAGLSRTLPNYVALEGVRGNEQFPSSRHNATLPFTRAAVGPIDYTICYAHERNRTTNAHQLALAAIYFSPLAFLYWYDSPEKYAIKPWPELTWFDECPTVWEESRALTGRIGEYVAVCRRSGARWFLGAITNESARTLRISLAFLERGRWLATTYADGPRAERPYETPVLIATREVSAADTLELALAADGGQAIVFARAP
jgi:alpha-glucosidase